MDGRLTCVPGGPVEHPLGTVRFGDHGFTEVWTTGRPVVVDQAEGVVCGHDGEYAFAAVRVPLTERCAPGVRDAYLRVFKLLTDLGYPSIFRMWNLIGRINEPNADGLETYQDFCAGRAQAFDLFPGDLPAGTGVGAPGDDVTVYLLARRGARHVPVENHLQVPAYRYPRRYGPRSPSFARAAWLPDSGQLFVSGTAAILGHRTVHPGDVEAQCRTTLSNLDVLTSRENLARNGVESSVVVRTAKVYVRREADLDVVRGMCSEAFHGADLAFLNVDLCRADLLVEIEAVCDAG
ncbi:FkbO/Hyg5 family chorismatase [Lentzea sp. NPDC051838]|uniref:FkbO/Hyg5 family chorismatase n=1 Tax=Lentzea sp. NPDC051838 TaxID=3154849 RepID=UPI003435940A